MSLNPLIANRPAGGVQRLTSLRYQATPILMSTRSPQSGVLVIGEAHLGQILSAYAAYYNEVRTHLACPLLAQQPTSSELG
jgi:hypothetical protein